MGVGDQIQTPMKTISAKTLHELAAERLDFWGYLSDRDHAVPTRAWIVDQAIPAFHGLLDQLGVLGYAKESWDCDDYAMAFVWFCRMLHARTVAQGKLAPCGIAVGHLWLTLASGVKHALCVAVVDDNELILIEPQPVENPILTLSENEEQSCEFLQF